MLTCVITGVLLEPKNKVYAVALDNDGGRCSVVCEEGLKKLLSLSPKIQVRQSYKVGKGVNIFSAKLKGDGDSMHVIYNPDENFLYALNVHTVRESKLKDYFPVGK